MKKITILLFTLLFASICNGQDIIDTDYSKYLKVKSFSYDKNQNGKFDDNDPLYNINKNIIIDYKEFNTAGNILRLKLDVGHDIIFDKTYKDIELYRIKEDLNISYAIKNKYEEILLILTPTKDNTNSYFVFIYDITFLY